jgi:hypothetical protein
MRKEAKVANFSSLFSDVMVWLSLPLFGGLSFWERNLTISITDRRLIQFLLLIGVFGWIWFWNSRAEQARLSQLLAPKSYFSIDADQNEELVISSTHRSYKEKLFHSQLAAPKPFEEIEKRINVTIDH